VQPIALTDSQMSALFAASHPLPPQTRSAFLEACARELAGLDVIGDGTVHRVVMTVQKRFFDPPADVDPGRKGVPRHEQKNFVRRNAVEA
jgi:hypothetical protein